MITDELKILVDEFLKDNNQTVLKIEMMPIDDIEDVLKTFNFEMDSDIDSNGWQLDFWIKFNGKVNLLLSGSWYYGNYNFKKI